MAGHDDAIRRIEVVAAGLKDLAAETIFVGGACIPFYVADPRLRDFRPTRDIDCIVEVRSYAEFTHHEERLRRLGFIHDSSSGASLVRWVIRGVVVDIIPDDGALVGFREMPWFKAGRPHAITQPLPLGHRIHLLSLPYFLAAKIEASRDRGGWRNGDFPADSDCEDLITILDGRDDWQELLDAPCEVKDFVLRAFGALLQNDDFLRSIAGHIGYSAAALERARMVVDKMQALVRGT